MWSFIIWMCLFVGCLLCADIYVDTGNPYRQGPLVIESFFVDKVKDQSPLRSLVYYPTSPGQYGVFFFVTGFNGIAVLEFYKEYLEGVAQHGFIVAGSDLVPTEHRATATDVVNLGGIEESYMKQLQWLQKNLSTLLESHVPGVEPRWDRLCIGSHSAGADTIMWMVQQNSSLSQAVVLMGPFTTNFRTPFNVSLPVLMVQNELSVQIPACIFKEFGYLHVWSLWQSKPKVRMNVKDYGHCAIGDMDLWETCNVLHFCKTNGNSSSLETYHTFSQGITSGFLTRYLGGYGPSLAYVTNATLMPVKLVDFAADV